MHVSTDYVFDGEAGPYDVEALPNPRGVYALTKHGGEQAVKALAFLRGAIARTAVVYGWPQAGRPNFGSWLVSALKEGKPVKLFEDQFVSPTLALNVAEMLAELGARRLTGVWHTAGARWSTGSPSGARSAACSGLRRADLPQPNRRRPPRQPPATEERAEGRPHRERADRAAAGLEDSLEWFHAAYRSAP